MNYNTAIHLDEWIDFDNQVHKFYEPLYPGRNAYNPFEDVSVPAKSEKFEADEKSLKAEKESKDSRR